MGAEALIAAGIASWAVGNTYWTFALVDLESPPYPSVSDAFWVRASTEKPLHLVRIARGAAISRVN